MRDSAVRLEQALPMMQEALARGSLVRFMPNGTSMLPMLRQGIDSVTLSPAPEKLRKYDLPLYRRDNGQFVIHRIVRAGETYTCVGDNQFALERGLRRDQMIALVTSFSRGEKEISVTAPSYRLYCRLWHWSRPIRRRWRALRGRLRRKR